MNMSYCIVKYDEQGVRRPIEALFRTRSQAESSAAVLRRLDSTGRYEVDVYAMVKTGETMQETVPE